MSRCEPSLKKSKAFKVIDDDQDRISELPDEILVWIMRFLSVDESEKTREVSRRWKELWEKTMIKVTPRLDFNGKEKLISLLASTQKKAKYGDHKAITARASEAYVNWVNPILELHESQTLDEFSICFPLVSTHSLHINAWLEFASVKRVRKLRLDLRPFSKFRINIGCRYDRSNYDIVSLASSLKLYCLRDVYFNYVNLDENFITSLLSNSPFLERLSVNNSQKLRKFELVGANKLEFLEIKGCLGLRNIQISWASNLRDLNLKNYNIVNHQRVDICAPNLRSFEFFCNSGAPVGFKDGVALHNLSYVRLYYNSREIKFDYFQKLLGHFSTVKTLILRMSVLQIGQTIDMWHQFPKLSNVERAFLGMKLTWSKSLLWLCALVKAAPILHTLSLQLYLRVGNPSSVLLTDTKHFELMEEVMAKKEKTNITYSHQNLKVLNVYGFTGCRTEVEFVLHLVDIAVSLEKITIYVLKLGTRNSNVQTHQELARLLKAKIGPKIDVVII